MKVKLGLLLFFLCCTHLIAQNATSGSSSTNQKTLEDYYNAAYAFIESNDINSAVSKLQEGINVYPNEAKLYALLGVMYIASHNPEKAYDYLKKAEQYDPSLLKTIYKKPILLGPIIITDIDQEFNNVCILSPTYGIIAGNHHIKIMNCDFVCQVGVQFGGLGIFISDSFFDTGLCIEYTQTFTQMGNVFIGNKYYGAWSNAE